MSSSTHGGAGGGGACARGSSNGGRRLDSAVTSERLSGFRRLAWSAVAATVALIALGGIVRITGSGLGCGDDWPLCHGRLLPPLDLPTLIEYGHRLAAGVMSVLVLALVALAWIRHRSSPAIRRPATLAALLLAVQVVLGALAVRLHLVAASVVVHLATAMLLLAALVVTALRASAGTGKTPVVPGSALRADRPEAIGPRDFAATTRLARLARLSAALGLVVILLGGLVANLGAGLACGGFPLCNGALLPALRLPIVVHWTHRLAALGLLALLGATFVASRPTGPGVLGDLRPARRLAAASLGVALLQVVIAAAMVLSSLAPALRAAHLVVAAVLWSCLVALAHEASRAVGPLHEDAWTPAAALVRGAGAGGLDRATAGAGVAARAVTSENGLSEMPSTARIGEVP